MSYIDKISVGGTVYDIQDSNAATATEVDELKSAVDDCFDFEYVENIFDVSAATKQRVLTGSGGTPSISGVYDTSDYIPVEKGDKLYFFGTSGYWYQWIVAIEVYDSSKGFLSGKLNSPYILPSADSYVEITDDGAAYMRFSYTASISVAMYRRYWNAYLPYGQKVVVSASLGADVSVAWDQVNGVNVELGDLDSDVQDMLKTALIPQNINKPIMSVETASYFWMRKQPAHLSQDNPLTISASNGGQVLTVTSGDISGLDSSDLYGGVVILYDDADLTCKPYIITAYDSTTITVYPPVEKAITAGTLAPLMYDSQHLTKYGFRAWMQHIFSANPKHCEKAKYLARYCPIGAYSAPPFTRLGTTPAFYNSTRNDYHVWVEQYGAAGAFIIPYADYSTVGEYGIEWEIDTGEYAGYLETFVGTAYLSNKTQYIEKDTGYEIHIEVYADGTKIYEKLKDTNYVERICVDYTKAQQNVKLKVFYTKMRNQTDTLFVGSTTFWVNENYPEYLFPKNAVVSQFCDSWGEYFDDGVAYVEPDTVWLKGDTWEEGASAKELKRLMNARNGYTANVFNCSKGGTTSRWGKSWWYAASGKFSPNVMITDFGINDYHTTMTPSTFNDLTDPYGGTIAMKNVPLDVTEYCGNMADIASSCIQSDIMPIIVECSIGASIDWDLSRISSMATEEDTD